MLSNSHHRAKKQVRILIVDDHPVVRDGLAAELETEPDLVVCGEAGDVPGALSQIEATRPDVAIVDISLAHGYGIDLIKRIRERDERLPVLVWSMYPESLYAERALRAGAQGYVNKGRATREILDALRAVLAGKVYLSGDQADQMLKRLVGRRDAPGARSSPFRTASWKRSSCSARGWGRCRLPNACTSAPRRWKPTAFASRKS